MAEHFAAGAERLHQLGQLVEPQRFEDSLAAYIDLQIEQSGEGVIGHLDAAGLIEQQQTFDHAVEQRFLLGSELGSRFSMYFLQPFDLGPGIRLRAQQLATPGETQDEQSDHRENNQERPKHI